VTRDAHDEQEYEHRNDARAQGETVDRRRDEGETPLRGEQDRKHRENPMMMRGLEGGQGDNCQE